MYIKRIELENIRCFSGKEEIFLSSGLNYLVGENNSGKSSILYALDYLRSFTPKDESKIYADGTESSKVVIDIADEELDKIFEEKELKKFIPYIFEASEGEGGIIRLRRQSQEEKYVQNGKDITIDSKKVAIWNSANERFENVTGIDAIYKRLLDLNFIYADEAPGDHVDMSSTKTLGKLIKECISDINQSPQWENFRVAHNNLFMQDGQGTIQEALSSLGKELSAVISEQYAEGIQAKIMFDMPEVNSFLKSGYVQISNGDDGLDETSLENKGTGLQRAFMLALLQIYAKKFAGGSSRDNRVVFGLDEPETWLHPSAQIKLINAVREIAKKQQVLLVTHSPYMLQGIESDNSKAIIFSNKLTLNKDKCEGKRVQDSVELNKCKLPYISWNAINYYVFGVPSVEFMDELYGHFQVKVNKGKSLREKEIIKSLNEHGINSTEIWIKEFVDEDGNGNKVKHYKPFNVPLCVYVRNSVHHPENRKNDKYTTDQLGKAIKELESVIEKLNVSGASS